MWIKIKTSIEISVTQDEASARLIDLETQSNAVRRQFLKDLLARYKNDGYTVSDLAKKHGLPVKRMKSIIDDLQQKALLYQLQTAFQKAA